MSRCGRRWRRARDPGWAPTPAAPSPSRSRSRVRISAVSILRREFDGKGQRRPVVIVGAGMAGPTLGSVARRARRAVGRARRGRHGEPWQPLDLPGQAQSRDLGSLRHRGAHGREGHHLDGRRGLSSRQAGLPLQSGARARPQVPALREPAAVLRRGIPLRALRCRAADRAAPSQQGDCGDVARRRRHGRGRDAGWKLHARRRVAGRLRRRAQPGAPHARACLIRARCSTTSS